MSDWIKVSNVSPELYEDVVLIEEGEIYWEGYRIIDGGFTCAQGHIIDPSHWMTIENATEILIGDLK